MSAFSNRDAAELSDLSENEANDETESSEEDGDVDDGFESRRRDSSELADDGSNVYKTYSNQSPTDRSIGSLPTSTPIAETDLMSTAVTNSKNCEPVDGDRGEVVTRVNGLPSERHDFKLNNSSPEVGDIGLDRPHENMPG